jgi:hypothetical protein
MRVTVFGATGEIGRFVVAKLHPLASTLYADGSARQTQFHVLATHAVALEFVSKHPVDGRCGWLRKRDLRVTARQQDHRGS